MCTRTSNKLKLFRRVCDLLSTALAIMIKLRARSFKNYIKTQGGNNNMLREPEKPHSTSFCCVNDGFNWFFTLRSKIRKCVR